MSPRFSYLFALAPALLLASCRFVGMKPDFSVVGDAISPPEADHVYVESRPAAATPIASAPFRPTPQPAVPEATPATARRTPAPPAEQKPYVYSRQQPYRPVDQIQDWLAPPTTASPSLRHYTVRPGDSLARIARLHNVPLGSLAAANGIDLNKPLIQPGQTLRIPQGGAAIIAPPRSTLRQAPTTAPAAKPTATAPLKLNPPAPAAAAPTAPRPAAGQYRVAPGDTLSRIARQHGISLQALMQANGISPENANSVRVGTLLSIPAKP